MSVIVLLGPQRLHPILGRVVRDLGVGGKIAAVTAGWQEREDEDDELAEHLSGRTVNLRLYARAEEVFGSDPEFARAYRERQLELKRAQELYRFQLDNAMASVRGLMRREGDDESLRAARKASFADVRRLDTRHLRRVRQVHSEFDQRYSPGSRGVLLRQRADLKKQLAGCQALAVAGGHVAVLLNRLRLFGLRELVGNLPVLAWSAGAMALADRVVLFHDTPPQGFGNAEVLESGLGLFQQILPMPHAERRLQLDDPFRVEELARRFAPLSCVPLDAGDYLRVEGSELWSEAPLRRLTVGGKVKRLEVA